MYYCVPDPVDLDSNAEICWPRVLEGVLLVFCDEFQVRKCKRLSGINKLTFESFRG